MFGSNGTLLSASAHCRPKNNRFNIHTLVCLCILLGFLLLAFILTGCNKQKDTIYSVGIINIIHELDLNIAGFKKGMTELGYIEGKNIRYISKGIITDRRRLQNMVRSLLDEKVDLIFTISTPATLAAKKATAGTGIPVVFTSVTDPVGAGIVESMQKPGGNVTGIAFGIQEAQRLKWLMRIAPGTRKIYVPYNSRDKAPVLALKKVQDAADKLGVQLITYQVYDKKTLEYAVSNIPAKADALFFLPDTLITGHAPGLLKLANKKKLPTSVVNISYLRDNMVLTSFGTDLELSGKQAARLANLILKGAGPADLPVETDEFYLGINLKVAKKIGLSIPDEILRQADIIIRE